MSPVSTPNSPKPARRQRRLWQGGIALGLLSAGAFAVLAATDQPVPPAPAPAGRQPAAKILAAAEVVDLAPLTLTELMQITGEVKALRRVSLSAQVAGLAGDVSHLPGDRVGQGDLLLSIATEDYRLALESARADHAALLAQVQVARATLARTRRLSASGTTPGTTLEQAQSAVSVLEAGAAAAGTRVAQARINLDRAGIRAPIAGTLASRSVEPGQLVQAGDPLFEIVDLNAVTVEALIPVGQAAQLAVGQDAAFWLPTAPADRITGRITGRITRIAPQVAGGTRAVPVWFEIDNARAGLRLGSFLRGEITLRRVSGRLALPRAAIRADGTVLAIRDGRIVPVAVTRGAAWKGGALVEVSGGLRADERIVALPLIGLAPGDAVDLAGK